MLTCYYTSYYFSWQLSLTVIKRKDCKSTIESVKLVRTHSWCGFHFLDLHTFYEITIYSITYSWHSNNIEDWSFSCRDICESSDNAQEIPDQWLSKEIHHANAHPRSATLRDQNWQLIMVRPDSVSRGTQFFVTDLLRMYHFPFHTHLWVSFPCSLNHIVLPASNPHL